MRIGKTAIREINEWASQSQIVRWSVHTVRDHRGDRIIIKDQNGMAICKARLELRRDGVALAFTHNVRNDAVSRFVMRSGWDKWGVASAILACLIPHAVPKIGESRVILFGDLCSTFQVKRLQHKILKDADKSWRTSGLPLVLAESVTMLKEHYRSLLDLDVKEQLDKLRDPLRFLISKKVSWECIQEIWKEEECRFVLES